MKKILNAKQMSFADSYTSNELKLPSIVLMERAALCVKDFIKKTFSLDIKIAIVVGTGNNGGDGMALARLLIQEGYAVKWFVHGDMDKFSEAAKLQYEILSAYKYAEASSIIELSDCDLLVDSIFGTGLSRELDKKTCNLIARINSFPAKKLAIDIPSGINANGGSIMGDAIKCDYTVTFAYELLGHHLYRGRDYCGKIICCNIGITDESLPTNESFVSAYEESDLNTLLPKRTFDSHKGTYGRVLVIAGKKDMAGAAYLSSKAAYTSGCGLVKIYTEEENRTALQQLLPEAMLTTYKGKFKKSKLKADLAWATTVLIGPAMGIDDSKLEMLEYVLIHSKVPIVIDADALNLISKNPELLKNIDAPCVITPHIGEMGLLLHKQVFDVLSDMLQCATNYSIKYNLVCVLKSAATVITSPTGNAYLNIYGNNGMSTGGSGDVLSGLIAGFMAQKCDPENAAVLGVLVHALAGDKAAANKGAYGMLAGDIIDGITKVI